MWVRQNQDGTYTICSVFAYLDNGKVVIINGDSDISKNYNGFKWEADQAELDRMAAVNKDYADQAELDRMAAVNKDYADTAKDGPE